MASSRNPPRERLQDLEKIEGTIASAMQSAEMTLQPGDQFDSYKDLQEAVDLYSKHKHVIYTITDSCRVETANKIGKARFEERFKYRNVTFQCKHGGKNKSKTRKSKPQGLRPNQKTYDTGCPAHMYISICSTSNTLKIKRHNEHHNHELGEHLFRHYPETRRLPEPLKEVAKSMIDAGVKSKSLQNRLMEDGQPFILPQDLNNIRSKLKQESKGGRSDEELLIAQLEKIRSSDPEATRTSKTSTDGTLELLFVATSDMKELYSLYPEVFVDGTYRVNKLRLPLYIFMVEDSHGTGQPVAYCFVL